MAIFLAYTIDLYSKLKRPPLADVFSIYILAFDFMPFCIFFTFIFSKNLTFIIPKGNFKKINTDYNFDLLFYRQYIRIHKFIYPPPRTII